MFNGPDVQKALDERIEPFEAIAPDGEATPAAEALWESWVQQGYALQELGASPKALCTATNEIASVRAEVHERTGDTARR